MTCLPVNYLMSQGNHDEEDGEWFPVSPSRSSKRKVLQENDFGAPDGNLFDGGEEGMFRQGIGKTWKSSGRMQDGSKTNQNRSVGHTVNALLATTYAVCCAVHLDFLNGDMVCCAMDMPGNADLHGRVDSYYCFLTQSAAVPCRRLQVSIHTEMDYHIVHMPRRK